MNSFVLKTNSVGPGYIKNTPQNFTSPCLEKKLIIRCANCTICSQLAGCAFPIELLLLTIRSFLSSSSLTCVDHTLAM